MFGIYFFPYTFCLYFSFVANKQQYLYKQLIKNCSHILLERFFISLKIEHDNFDDLFMKLKCIWREIWKTAQSSSQWIDVFSFICFVHRSCFESQTNWNCTQKIERETKNTKTFKRIWQPKIVLWTSICAFGVYASSINKLDIVFTDRMYSTAFVVVGASAAAVAFVAVVVFFVVVFVLLHIFFLSTISKTHWIVLLCVCIFCAYNTSTSVFL